MNIVKKLLITVLLFLTSINAANQITTYGVDIVVMKKSSINVFTKIHYNKEYTNKMKNMSLREVNIYIKKILIKAFRETNLNASELGKFHIFITKEQLEKFRALGILLVRLNYKAKAYTQIVLLVKVR